MSALAQNENPGDERSRLAVLATGLPLLLFTAPCFLPFDRGRSLLEETRGKPGDVALLALIFGWPALVGVLGFTRALRKKPLGKAAFGVPAAVHALAAALGLTAVAMAVFGGAQARDAPGIAATVVAWIGVLAMVFRGARRADWERWIALVAAIWLFYAGVLLLLATGRPGELIVPPAAVWVLIFALSAAVVPIGWAMVPRRA